MQFTVVMSFVSICIILGLIITELWRKLAVTREEVERLWRMNSRNYHHRIAMERAYWDTMRPGTMDQCKTATAALRQAASESRDDHD